MSLATHKLTITPAGGTGTTKTLEAWGIVSAKLTVSADLDDELVLEFPLDYTEAAVFPAWAVAELYDPSNVRRFYGMVMRPRQRHENSKRQHQVRVLGPAFWMKRVNGVISEIRIAYGGCGPRKPICMNSASGMWRRSSFSRNW